MEETTLILGRILALYLLTAGVGFIVATPFYASLTRNADSSDAMAVNISGMVHLFIGFAIVVTHFTFDGLLASMVTVLGIAFVVRGLAYYWVPRLIVRSSEVRASSLRVMGAAFIVVGAWMAYLAFVV